VNVKDRLIDGPPIKYGCCYLKVILIVLDLGYISKLTDYGLDDRIRFPIKEWMFIFTTTEPRLGHPSKRPRMNKDDVF
jgi:hypothetical protein